MLLSDFLIQFSVRPMTGVLITAFLLTLITLFTARLLHRLAGNQWLLPLALLPAIALAFLHFNVNYLYMGTVAFLWMAVCLYGQVCINKPVLRFFYSLISALFLYMIGGAVALLYSILLLMVELFRRFKQSYWYLLPLLLVGLAGKLCMEAGLAGDLKHILLPDNYFTQRLQPGSNIYLPWGLMAAVCLIGCLCKPLKLRKRWMQGTAVGIQIVGIVYLLWTGSTLYVRDNIERFKELSYYVYHQQWDTLLERCKYIPMNNLLNQNCRNLALAEKGLLAEKLFEVPCVDIQSIYIIWDKTPYTAALLSDIYFSMGHISLSQRYAFEANESAGDYSPRLLKRLVQTNLIYGHYGTAEKYINLLEKTLHYKEWANSHRRFLWNDAAVEADPLLGSKRQCLFPDNRGAGLKGLDDDLMHIVQQNPSHKATIQYLGSLYLLSKDIPKFQATMEAFYGTDALPEVLPRAFQEGVAVFARDNAEITEHYQIAPDILQKLEAFKQKKLRETDNLWFFLRYQK